MPTDFSVRWTLILPIKYLKQASHPDNAREIDRYILGFAARGELDFFENLVLDGYDHIVDITDKDGNSIIKIAETRGQKSIVDFLSSVKEFEENREKLHRAIREGNIDDVVDILSQTDGAKLAKSKNYFGKWWNDDEGVIHFNEICFAI